MSTRQSEVFGAVAVVYIAITLVAIFAYLPLGVVLGLATIPVLAGAYFLVLRFTAH